MPRKLYSILILLACLGMSVVFVNRHAKDAYVFYGDGLGYYIYLPAVFIYDNVTELYALPKDKGIPENVIRYGEEMKVNAVKTEKGRILNQYTYGVAAMDFPFFAIAHLYEKAMGLPANGYSKTYDSLIKISSVVYVILALFVTYRILRRYFSSIHSLLTVTLIYMASHLFWFTVYQAGMSHQPIMFLYALLVYLTIKVHEQPKPLFFALIGFIVGFIIVTRPTDIFCAFIPLLYKVYNKQSFNEKIDFIKQHFSKIMLLIAAAIIPVLPQLVYWKIMSGHFVFYSYGSQGFYWLHPKILNGIFYYSNGWLPYAPIMIFALAGLLLFKTIRYWWLSIYVILPLYAYVIYAWYCYNYINGLGSRPMIHLYPLLAIPLAASIQYISKKGWLVKSLFATVCVFFIAMNYSFSMLKARWVLDSESANIVFCKQMLFRQYMNYNDFVVYDTAEPQPDSSTLTKLSTLGYIDFQDSPYPNCVSDMDNAENIVYKVADEEEYPPMAIKLLAKDIPKEAKWFKCSARARFHTWPGYRRRLLVLNVKRKNESVYWKVCRMDNKVGVADKSCAHTEKDYVIEHFDNDRWGPVYFYTKVPRNMQEGDTIQLSVWNSSKNEMYIDNISLDIYK